MISLLLVALNKEARKGLFSFEIVGFGDVKGKGCSLAFADKSTERSRRQLLAMS